MAALMAEKHALKEILVISFCVSSFEYSWGWLGAAKVLGIVGKGPVALAVGGCYLYIFSLFSFPLSLEDGPI